MVLNIFNSFASNSINLLQNGDFETGDFTNWVNKDFGVYEETKLVQTNEVYSGTYAAQLTTTNARNRAAKMQNVTIPSGKRWNFSFAMKDNGGDHYKAGVAVYYYIGSTYIGHTYFYCTLLQITANSSTEAIYSVAEATHNQWNYFSYELNSISTYVPSDVQSAWASIDKVMIYIHNYGVSGYGGAITVYYDAISFREQFEDGGLKNGGFEAPTPFLNWEQYHFSGTAEIRSDTSYEGTNYAHLRGITTSQRVAFRQWVIKVDNRSWILAFAIKHNNGTFNEAGLIVYYYDIDQNYMGRTYWFVSKEGTAGNSTTDLFLDIRSNSANKWYYMTVNLSDPLYRPSNVSDFRKIAKFHVYLHVYGLASYGTNIEVSYDAISLKSSIKNETELTTSSTNTSSSHPPTSNPQGNQTSDSSSHPSTSSFPQITSGLQLFPSISILGVIIFYIKRGKR